MAPGQGRHEVIDNNNSNSKDYMFQSNSNSNSKDYMFQGNNSNSNLLISKVIVIVIYYIDFSSNCNSNSNR